MSLKPLLFCSWNKHFIAPLAEEPSFSTDAGCSLRAVLIAYRGIPISGAAAEVSPAQCPHCRHGAVGGSAPLKAQVCGQCWETESCASRDKRCALSQNKMSKWDLCRNGFSEKLIYWGLKWALHHAWLDVAQKSADLLRVSRHPLGFGSPFAAPSLPAVPTHWQGAEPGLSLNSCLHSRSSVHLLPEVELSSVRWAAAAGAIAFHFPVKNVFSKLSVFTQKISDLWKGHFLSENPSAVEFPN